MPDKPAGIAEPSCDAQPSSSAVAANLSTRRSSTRIGPTVNIVGVDVNAMTFDQVIDVLVRAPADGARLRIHFCTTHTLVEAADSPRLREALAGAPLVVADGMPLVWVGRLRGASIGRVCGPDTMPALLDRSREGARRHFFYGGADGIAERLAARMRARFPGLIIAGTYSPPFRPLTPEEDREIVDLINAARPDYVWVGLGSPKQEIWAAEHRDSLDAAVLLPVGAAFDYYAGIRPRAPWWMQRAGLEWLFRLISEPRRLVRRYTVVNARFIWLLAQQEVARRSSRAG